PTGDGVCPPQVTHAHHIDHLINERAGTHDLNHLDFNAFENENIDDNNNNNHSVASDQDEPYHASPPIQHTAIVRSTAHTDAPIPRHNARGAAATDLLTHLSSAFDPAAQCNHDEEWANHSLATTQLLTQGQQLRDLQATLETIERDWAELAIEMMEMNGSMHRHHIRMLKWKNLHQEWFPEGGGSMKWITDEGGSTASEAPKPPRLQRCGPSSHLKYADHPYFKDLADEPCKAVQREGSQEI
ncbi:uncharacterized protein EDB91DRAFT_1254461, partial [Suillus paluster]|uniref:uncharacterized protein n=1 Tax=Suillus paluster TaxID=48578 RepID=UPI001B866A23